MTGMFCRIPEHPRQRTAQACDKCRIRKAKCTGSYPSCQRCLSRSLVCEYTPQTKTRGVGKAKKRTEEGQSIQSAEAATTFGAKSLSEHASGPLVAWDTSTQAPSSLTYARQGIAPDSVSHVDDVYRDVNLRGDIPGPTIVGDPLPKFLLSSPQPWLGWGFESSPPRDASSPVTTLSSSNFCNEVQGLYNHGTFVGFTGSGGASWPTAAMFPEENDASRTS